MLQPQPAPRTDSPAYILRNGCALALYPMATNARAVRSETESGLGFEGVRWLRPIDPEKTERDQGRGEESVGALLGRMRRFFRSCSPGSKGRDFGDGSSRQE